jgi:hypothetical protein
MMATTFEVMPVDVFEGGGGHIVFMPGMAVAG